MWRCLVVSLVRADECPDDYLYLLLELMNVEMISCISC